MTDIVRATGDDWQLVREIRLRSLSSDPAAFGATWEEESAFPDSVWTDRITSFAWFLAVDGSEPIGVIACRAEDEDKPDDRELQAMWVVQSYRRQGVGGQLIEKVMEWAKEDGASTVSLYVGPSNDAAIRSYEHSGFSDSGERWEYDPDDPKSAWICLVRDVES